MMSQTIDKTFNSPTFMNRNEPSKRKRNTITEEFNKKHKTTDYNTNTDTTIQTLKEKLRSKFEIDENSIENIINIVSNYINPEKNLQNNKPVIEETHFVTENISRILYNQKKIGEGSYSLILEALGIGLKNDQIKIKKYAVKKTDDRGVQFLKNEYDVLNVLHPKGKNIEGIQTRLKKFTTAGLNAFCYTEIMSGDLFDLLKAQKSHKLFSTLSLSNLGELVEQLLNGLAHIHTKGYIHGDIKPENCLFKVDDKGKIEKFVISDFGGAVPIGDDPFTHSERYFPVDTFSNDPSIDVFAMALTLIEIFSQTTLSNIILKKKKKELTLERTKDVDKNHIFTVDLIKNEIKSDLKKIRSELENSYPNPEDLIINYASEIYLLFEKNGIPKPFAEILLKGIGPKEQRSTAIELRDSYAQTRKELNL